MFHMRKDEREGAFVKEWMWVEQDHGLFDGPYHDWMKDHRDKIIKHCPVRNVVVQAGGGCGMYPAFLLNILD